MNAYSPGLEGVIAGETAISTVGKKETGLTYRGYAIIDLAEQASFEEVAYLLIHGRLPDSGELTCYRKRLASLRGLPEGLKGVLEQLPPAARPMDVLRTGCSALGTMEPETGEHGAHQVADRLLAVFPAMLLYWHHFHQSGRRIDTDTGEESLAGHFLCLLHGMAAPELQRRAVDVSLILYAEHEFNASTFSARVTTSTLADFYGAVTSAIGTLALGVNMSIAYTKAGVSGSLTAHARETAAAGPLSTYVVEVKDDSGETIATFQGTAYRKRDKIDLSAWG